MKTKLLTLLTFALVLVLLVLGLASCAACDREPVLPEHRRRAVQPLSGLQPRADEEPASP